MLSFLSPARPAPAVVGDENAGAAASASSAAAASAAAPSFKLAPAPLGDAGADMQRELMQQLADSKLRYEGA
jgi:hypothetical protein